MGNQEYIVSLDIGTSKIRVMIGELHTNGIQIIGVGAAEAHGMKKGAIVDIDQTVESIKQAVQQAEQMVDLKIRQVYVGVSGNHIALLTSHGVVAVSSEDREVSETDIERVIQASQVIALPPDREIIDIVPQQFMVDGLEGITDPRGMIGVRLEVDATVVTGSKTWMHNLSRCIERAGLEVLGYVLTSYAAAEISLSKDEKELGVVLLDLGAGATTVSVFENGNLIQTSSMPIGGDYITNDISIGLRTRADVAERLKITHGQAMISQASSDETFKVPRIGSQVEKEFNQLDLANIIEPRVQEIVEIIAGEVHRMIGQEPAGGYVLTGGVAAMRGFTEITEMLLDHSVRISIPDFVGLRDPSYVNGAGIIVYIAKRYARSVANHPSVVRTNHSKPKVKKKTGKRETTFDKVKNWLGEFI